MGRMPPACRRGILDVTFPALPTPDAEPAFDVSTDAVRLLAARGEVRRYRKDTILIEEGDRGNTLYVILEGRLRAYSAAANGREITFGIYGPGEYLGEMSLDGGVRSASVQTLEPTVCSVVTRTSLRDFIREHPDFAFELLTKVIRRARAATLSAKNLALNDVYGRLRLVLESLAETPAEGPRTIADRPTQRELANRIGCSREMVSRVMKDLEQGGYVRAEAGRLVLVRALPSRW
jgi:CRP/FNR family transcriptional regulator, cyclic AMP receptor protein